MNTKKSNTPLSRREFLKITGLFTSGMLLTNGCGKDQMVSPAPVSTANPTTVPTTLAAVPTAVPAPVPTSTPALSQTYLSVAHGPDPEAITKAAVDALGGIERFVKAGNDVIIKPNICVAYHPPEYAATTNPVVVATLVKLCLGAGAKRVRVMDHPFGGTAEAAYAISGIEEAVKAAGGEMELMSPVKYLDNDIPEGRDITSLKVYQEALDTDVLINVPVAKHHSLARLTLGTKNLFGLAWNPNSLHVNLGQRAADLASLYRPALTVVDAVRILVAHGPTGGSLDDVQQLDTVIASHDIVAVDSYAATLFGMTGADIAYIKAGANMGLGTMDLDSIKIDEFNL